jgi:hypothetical protein
MLVNDDDGGGGGGAGGGDDDWRNSERLCTWMRGRARGERENDGISSTQHEREKDGGDSDGEFQFSVLVCGLDLAKR